MHKSNVRVLIVDDFHQWRLLVRNTLEKEGLCRIVEAADGAEALQKAKEHQPDLVVLDIGLPKLNGIEVARRIEIISPKSRVIFFTQNAYCDIAEEALPEYVSGYVPKTAASRELIPAIRAALHGRQFFSAGLTNLTLKPEMA